ncbi:MAG TPA: hypothetical protein VGD07_11705 [Methylomirabilota bacterium]
MTDPVAELYAVPPSAFTRERNARAAALEKAGHDAQARAVRQLRRPAVSLWATNQLARAAPKELATLIDAAERARQTQLRDPRAAGEAVQRVRAQLDALGDRAGQVLSEHGYHPTPATLRRIADTLMGAVVDRRRAQELRRGRLTEELSPPGFEILSGAGRPPLRTLPGGRGLATAPASRPRNERHARAEQRRAQAEQERQRRRQHAEELERDAQIHRTAALTVEREAEDLAAKLAAAQGRLRDARRVAAAAEAASRKARRAARR